MRLANGSRPLPLLVCLLMCLIVGVDAALSQVNQDEYLGE